MTAQGESITIRRAVWPHDAAAVAALDTSFTTDRVYRLVRGDLSFELREEALAVPIRKCYPLHPELDEERRMWNFAVVAERKGQVVGFAAAEYTAWNRRVVLWHLYVAPPDRGHGIGSRLLDEVTGYARETGARCVWVETQNVNAPAVRFYFRSGFRLCGLDESLYDSSLNPDEVALFFQRPVMEASRVVGQGRDGSP